MRYVILAIVAALALPAKAQLYRWTDAQGKIHFTDTPPPATAKTAKYVRRTPGTSAGADADAGAAPNEPFVLQEARRNFPVKLYSAPDCEPCDEGRKLLNARGVPFTEISVTDESGIAELRKLAGTDSVPVLIVGRSVQRGFEQGAFHSSLDAAGYPKTGILPRRNQAQPKQSEPAATEETQAAAETRSGKGPYAPRFR